jgi:hypothetical protein
MAWTDITKPSVGDAIKKSLIDDVIDDLSYLHDNLTSSGSSGGSIENGSFETDSDADGIPDGWTRTLYTGGSATHETSDIIDGAKSYKFTRAAGASNGGGTLTSGFIACSILRRFDFSLLYKTSAAGIKVMVQVAFYDATETIIGSAQTVYTSTSNPLIWTMLVIEKVELPAAAKWAKITLIGGYTDTDVAGSVYFDDVRMGTANPSYLLFTDSTINQAETATTGSTSFADLGTTHNITIPTGTKFLAVYVESADADNTNMASARVKIGTTYSTEFQHPDDGTFSTYRGGYVYLDVSALQGAQTLGFQGKITTSGSAKLRCPSANAKFCKTGRIVVDMPTGTTTTDAS